MGRTARRRSSAVLYKAEFEEAKKRAGGIEKWIEEQLKHTSVTVVLYGAETYDREWVRHEIKRSHELKKGILAIDIHGIKDPQKGVDVQGRNPLGYWNIDRNGQKVPLTQIYRSYNWVRDDGYRTCQRGSRPPPRNARVINETLPQLLIFG
jgi:MTH538 TIR-like domain (DUF1863)